MPSSSEAKSSAPAWSKLHKAVTKHVRGNSGKLQPGVFLRVPPAPRRKVCLRQIRGDSCKQNSLTFWSNSRGTKATKPSRWMRAGSLGDQTHGAVPMRTNHRACQVLHLCTCRSWKAAPVSRSESHYLHQRELISGALYANEQDRRG